MVSVRHSTAAQYLPYVMLSVSVLVVALSMAVFPAWLYDRPMLQFYVLRLSPVPLGFGVIYQSLFLLTRPATAAEESIAVFGTGGEHSSMHHVEDQSDAFRKGSLQLFFGVALVVVPVAWALRLF